MMISIQLINFASVGVFGMVLSAAFCDILWTKKKVYAMSGGIAAILLLQGIICFAGGADSVEKFYPLITHIPLIVLLCILKRKLLWPAVSVLTAYLCCELRRWLALLAVAVFAGDSVMQNITELAVTFPVLLLLMRYIAPAVRSVSYCPLPVQCQFGLVPALYYGVDNLMRIDTGVLLENIPAVVEFMPFVCGVAYLFLALHISEGQRVRRKLQQNQEILDLQLRQAVREIAALRESQDKVNIYSHDMRHHMQYLSSCIENGRLEQAQDYIYEMYSEIETNKVTVFCENEAVNLIFSIFKKRAEDNNVQMQVRAMIPQLIPVEEKDLCVLLFNALENALHACSKQGENGRERWIEVFVYEKDGKLLLQIVNSCGEEILFEDGIPVTKRPGHGIGVRSICTIVEQYGGIYTFLANAGQFILRISI